MVPSRLNFRSITSPLAAGVSLVLFLAVTSCSSSTPTTARAEDAKADEKAEDKKEEKAEDSDPDFAVPDGTPEEILKFVDKLKARRPKFANRQEAIEDAIKTQRAMIAAGTKILDQETDEKTAVKAATMKLNALTVLAANQIGDSAKEAMTVAAEMKEDKRTAVADVVSKFWTPIRIFNAMSLKEGERKDLIQELVTDVSESKFSQQAVGAATQLGELLADNGLVEDAGELYDKLSAAAAESDDPKFKPNADRFKAIGRRLRLPGNFMSIEGKKLDGEDFDWAQYRGKVVLVDFWATWCGPCVAELPNVKENYKKYHDKGFDVVGISLDRSKAPLEKFIDKEEIPWTQLYDEHVQKDKGWNHPMAQYYGINAIPAVILVDKDGKVVSMRARGEELGKLLEKMLGKAE